jgi:hypothetical protein
MGDGIWEFLKNGAVGMERLVNGDEAAKHTAASWDAMGRGDLATASEESEIAKGVGSAYWTRKLGLGGNYNEERKAGGLVGGVRDADVSVTRAMSGDKAAHHTAASWDALAQGDLAANAEHSGRAKGASSAYWLRKLGFGAPSSPDKAGNTR